MANRYVVLSIKRRRIACGVATITNRALILTVALNVLLVRSTSKASGLHGAEGSSMMAIRTNAAEGIKFSAVPTQTIRKQPEVANMQIGQLTLRKP